MPPQSYGMAVTAMIMGILLCIPYLTNLLAVIFGIVGLAKAKSRNGAGRGMAVTGLILGFIGLAMWTTVMVAGVRFWNGRKLQVNNFVGALASNNTQGAMAECHSAMQPATLRQTAAQIQGWGPLKQAAIDNMNYNNTTGSVGVLTCSGSAEFTNTSKRFDIEFVQEGNAWKIKKYLFK
jgi:hypothetical protein